MTVYIVVQMRKFTQLIESVWSTRALAESARWFHAEHAKLPADNFAIVEREVDKANK